MNHKAEGYLNRAQLRRLVPVSDMTIRRWTDNPKIGFPEPVKFGNGRNYWKREAVEGWIERRESRA